MAACDCPQCYFPVVTEERPLDFCTPRICNQNNRLKYIVYLENAPRRVPTSVFNILGYKRLLFIELIDAAAFAERISILVPEG